MRPFHQPMPLLFNIQDALLTRQHAYGAVLWNAILERRVQVNGDGHKMETAGMSYGLHCLLLLKVASNLQDASARPSAMVGVSASS